MSSGSLDREVLKSKSRDELSQIAVALGAKPSSRSRKAEIVDLIIDQAKPPDAAERESGPADAVLDEAIRSEADATEGPTTDRSDEPRSADGPQATATEPVGEQSQVPRRRRRRAAAPDDGSEGTSEGGQTQAKERGPEIGDGKEKPAAEGETTTTVAEPGNRRRRRRGRNRDADGDDTVDSEPVAVTGVLDLRDEGYGFLRTNGLLPSREDVYVSAKQVRLYGLRRGDVLTGAARPAARSEKNPAMLRIDTVSGRQADSSDGRPSFGDLTPVFPTERLRLERLDRPDDLTSRVIDLMAPIGKGQRGLIISPPRAGKTTMLKGIAQAIEANHPDVELIVLLLDERPEEVTDLQRSIAGEVVASTFDRPPEEHAQVAELTLERARRMVEDGRDVVVLLDGMTRLARAYNLSASGNARVLAGGVDAGALHPTKQFLGAARNLEDGGSLTILATILVETGSVTDDVIFEELRDTANMEVRLDGRLSDRCVHPAIDLERTSTRHDDLLMEPSQFELTRKLRRTVSNTMSGEGDDRPGAALELLLDRLAGFPTNEAFLADVAKNATT
jgi:transcription termination factor Rho